MTIAAHILSFHPPTAHLYECLLRIAEQNPNVQIVFFTNAAVPKNLPQNCSVQIIAPALKSSIMLHYWYNYKLPNLLKLRQAGIFITENGILSFKPGAVRQIMLLPEWFTDIKINESSFKNYRKRFFKYFLKKATRVLTASPVIQQQLEEKFTGISRFQTIYFGIEDSYRPITIEAQEAIKKKYSNEKDFFAAQVTLGNKQQTIPLLKAFSIFKKWHKSEMKLVLFLHQLTAQEAIPNLNSYRFKDDLVFINTPNLDETALLLASAYAFIYLPEKIVADNLGIYAFKCGTPLITYKNKSTQAAFEDAALYAQNGDAGLAEQLSELYKNETLRKQYIQKGLEYSQRYTWAHASSLLWQAIQ